MPDRDRTLDWRPNPDPRSMLFLVSSMDCYAGSRAYTNIMRRNAVFLDQGREGACTGFGFEHVRALSPYPQQTSHEQAREMYLSAQLFDEWEGEAYEGSSVNGVMKAGREAGKIKSWRWCTTLGELDHALSYHGAVEGGTWWWTGMFEPDASGLLHTTGYREGGHAYAVAGKRVLNGAKQYRIENSWGVDWGDNGGAWISEFDMQQLLSDDGEFACPVKVRS
jgi:hypothetical protein